ncbi:unnamed protein product [Mortierella alpina]
MTDNRFSDAEKIIRSRKRMRALNAAHNVLRKADVLFLSARAGVTPVCYWATPRFWPLIRDPENKSLILQLMEGSDTESMSDAQSSAAYQDEVPKFEFKRAGLGYAAIMDQAKHDVLFPQFKARALGAAIDLSKIPGEEVLLIATSGPDMVAAFATPKLLPFLTRPEGWNAIKAHLQAPLVDINTYDFFELFRLFATSLSLPTSTNTHHVPAQKDYVQIPANHRYKIEKRVKDHHRKLRKDAKSKPNGHHKNKKDPGIPNNFPGKEKILQQIADQKLKAQEEKDKQKEIRRKAAEKARKANKARNINPAEPAKEKKAKEATSTEGVLSKAAKRKATAAAATSSPATKKTKTTKKAAAKEEEEDEEDADADAPYSFAEHFVSGEGDEEVDEEEAEAEEEEEDDE